MIIIIIMIMIMFIIIIISRVSFSSLLQHRAQCTTTALHYLLMSKRGHPTNVNSLAEKAPPAACWWFDRLIDLWFDRLIVWWFDGLMVWPPPSSPSRPASGECPRRRWSWGGVTTATSASRPPYPPPLRPSGDARSITLILTLLFCPGERNPVSASRTSGRGILGRADSYCARSP